MPLLWGHLMIVAGLFLVLCSRSKSEFIWQQDRTRRLFYGSTGLDLIERQLQQESRVPVENTAVISGYWTQDQLEDAQRLGCHVLRKPCRVGEIAHWLDVCEARQEQRFPDGSAVIEKPGRLSDDLAPPLCAHRDPLSLHLHAPKIDHEIC